MVEEEDDVGRGYCSFAFYSTSQCQLFYLLFYHVSNE